MQLWSYERELRERVDASGERPLDVDDPHASTRLVDDVLNASDVLEGPRKAWEVVDDEGGDAEEGETLGRDRVAFGVERDGRWGGGEKGEVESDGGGYEGLDSGTRAYEVRVEEMANEICGKGTSQRGVPPRAFHGGIQLSTLRTAKGAQRLKINLCGRLDPAERP